MEISRIQKINRVPKLPKGHPLHQSQNLITTSTSTAQPHMSPNSFTPARTVNQMSSAQFLSNINTQGVSNTINAEIFQNRVKPIKGLHMWHSAIVNNLFLAATNRPGFPETQGNIRSIQMAFKENPSQDAPERFLESQVEDFGLSFIPIYPQLKDISEKSNQITNKSTRGYVSKILKESKRCFFLTLGSITHINPIELMNIFREEIIELCVKHPNLLLENDPSYEKIWSVLA